MSIFEVSAWSFSLETFAWEQSFGNFRLGTLRLGTFGWELSALGSLRLGAVVWKLSLGNVCLGLVVSELSPGDLFGRRCLEISLENFRLEMRT